MSPTGGTGRRSTSLRVQIGVLLVVLVTAGLAIAGLIATAALRTYLVDRVDQQLTRTVATFTRLPAQLPPQPATQEVRPEPESRFLVALLATDGSVSEVLGTPDVTDTDLPNLSGIGDTPLGVPVTTSSISGDATWRVVVQARESGDGYVLVAAGMNDVDETVARLVLLEIVVGGIVVLTTGGLGFVLVGRRLRPLSDMTAATEEIAAGDLSRRVADDQGSSEVNHLAESFNTMVHRIEVAFTAQQASEAEARAREGQMRQFVADAGHELRTPLTSIRGFSELAREGALTSPDQVSTALARIETESTRMGLLVDDLLLLARMDAHRPLERVRVDLLDVVLSSVQRMSPLNPDHPITVRAQVDDGEPIVRGDANRLAQVSDNLLANAVTHTPPGTEVTVTVRTEVGDGGVAATVVLEVADNGPGLPDGSVDRVFERFYRADPARTRTTGGSGLGLSIAAAIVEAHDGEITVRSAPAEGTAFTVRLPAAP